MFNNVENAIAMCTVRRHPEGGFTPVLHLDNVPAPNPTDGSVSFPTTSQAVQYARNHYSTTPIVVADECYPHRAA